MYDFLKFFDELTHRFPLHLTISYSKIADYTIEIYKKGCADDYPNSNRIENDAVVVLERDMDIDMCFAKALVALKTWMLENNDGY